MWGSSIQQEYDRIMEDYWSQASKQVVQTVLSSTAKIDVDSINQKNEYSTSCSVLHPSGVSMVVG